MRNSERLPDRYRTAPAKTREEVRGRMLSPVEWGSDIMKRALVGTSVTRREVLSALRMLPDDHDGETLKESLRNLEQDILRSCYETEITNISNKLARSKVVSHREIVSRKHSNTNRLEIGITQSHQERMRKKLEHLDLLLQSNPLMDRRQRRRKRKRETELRK